MYVYLCVIKMCVNIMLHNSCSVIYININKNILTLIIKYLNTLYIYIYN